MYIIGYNVKSSSAFGTLAALRGLVTWAKFSIIIVPFAGRFSGDPGTLMLHSAREGVHAHVLR